MRGKRANFQKQGFLVADTELQREADVAAATSTLAIGLKSCRAVISGYRSLLAPEQPIDASPNTTERADASPRKAGSR